MKVQSVATHQGHSFKKPYSFLFLHNGLMTTHTPGRTGCQITNDQKMIVFCAADSIDTHLSATPAGLPYTGIETVIYCYQRGVRNDETGQ
jgi:hypothetical protein